MTILHWGILGTGRIARTFAQAVADSETGQVVGIGSRSSGSADAFGTEFHITRRYGSYAALLADPDVQVVYISLPNHLHAEWIVRCAEAGKHILCEKPLTVNHAEAMTALEAVRRHGVFLMEAFMYRCHPQTARLKELLDAGVIGQVRLIQSNFSYNMGQQYENIRLSNPAAGGGIMDVGCYTASLARLVAGAEPSEVCGVAEIGPISRVDELATASLRWPGGILGSLVCGNEAHSSHEARIWGSQGHIHIPEPWFPGAEDARIIVHKDGQEPEEFSVPGGGGLYTIEADLVARCLDEGRTEAPAPAMTWADSLGNMALLDSWRRAVGLTFDAEKPEALAKPPLLPPNSDPQMTYGTIAGLDKPVARLIMGTMVASPQNMPYVCALFDHYVSLGGNCLDTARVYGTEGAVGEWLRLRGNRAQIVLIAKGAHHDQHGPRVNSQAIAEDLARSLELLQTDYIDLYLLHRDDPDVPVGPIVECLNEHKAAGRIRAFGGSNWTHARLQEANDYAHAHGLTSFAASSPNFSLAVQNEPTWANCLSASTEPGERDWYAQTGIPLLAWSSQAQGFFTGRYRRDDTSNSEMVRVWYNDANFVRLERVNELARQKGVTPVQVALAYVLCQPFPTFALIGPRTLEETRTTTEGLRLTLTPDELAWLNLEA